MKEFITKMMALFMQLDTASEFQAEMITNDIKIAYENHFNERKSEKRSHAIEFHNWMRKNDTKENSHTYFHATDEDMYGFFLESRDKST